MEKPEENPVENPVENPEEKKGVSSGVIIAVCIFLIVGLDVFAGFMGLQAETAQQDVKHNRVWLLECKAPSKTAFTFAIISLSCLLAAQLMTIMVGCSLSSLSKPKFSGYLNITCLCLTLVVTSVGAGMLARGIWTNRESRSKCGVTNKNVLYMGGQVCFLHAIVSVIFYFTTIIAKKDCC
ncbi:unnamed protein product [Cochlearia groenlandica]